MVVSEPTQTDVNWAPEWSVKNFIRCYRGGRNKLFLPPRVLLPGPVLEF